MLGIYIDIIILTNYYHRVISASEVRTLVLIFS